MKKFRFVLPLLLCLVLIACAGLQDKWNALTPDEKARIIIGDIQGQLDNAFTQGKAYVTTKPQYAEKWKKEIVPSFSVANQSLASVIAIGKTKPITPEFVYARVMIEVTNVLNLLISIGMIK